MIFCILTYHQHATILIKNVGIFCYCFILFEEWRLKNEHNSNISLPKFFEGHRKIELFVSYYFTCYFGLYVTLKSMH